MRIKAFLFIILSVLCLPGLNAQKSLGKITITGTVLGSDKKPITDAMILIDDIITNSITDSEGNFEIRVKPDASKIGIFTFGNGIKEEEIGGRTRVDISFSTAAYLHLQDQYIGPGEDATNRRKLHSSNFGSTGLQGRSVLPGDEAVEVGYARMKRKYITTDISYIDGSNKKYASYSSVYDMIQREVPGVMVIGKSIIIQGSANMFGSVPALVIIDGVPGGSLDDIAPTSVESISVLKGTAAAIYGSRGYGGAVIVTTKTFDE